MRIILFLFGVLSFVQAEAQRTGYVAGTRVGLGVSEFRRDGYSEGEGIFHGEIGMVNEFWFSNNIGLGADLMLSSRGDKVDGEYNFLGVEYDYIHRYNLYALDVPLRVIVRFGSNDYWFSIFGGYDFGFNFAGLESEIYEEEGMNNERGYRNRDWNGYEVYNGGLFGGLGFSVMRGRKAYSVDARLMPGTLGTPVMANSTLGNHIWAISFSTTF